MRLLYTGGCIVNIIIFLWILTPHMVDSWSVNITNYHYWTPDLPHLNRTDLYCRDRCGNRFRSTLHEYERCCTCHAQQCWELLPASQCGVTVANLHVEYTSIYGNSVLFVDTEEVTSSFFHLYHTHNIMTIFPDNICDFKNTLKIELPSNFIHTLGQISCLKFLNTLDISFNKITSIANSTFQELKYLRLINLNGNFIDTLEPNTLNIFHGSLFVVLVSENPLYDLDVSNVLTPGSFCMRNFSSIQTKEIANKNNYDVKEVGGYIGPGRLDFGNSKLINMINMSTVGVSVYDMTKYVDLSINYAGSSVSCDCSLVPYLRAYGYPEISQFWYAFFNFTCANPAHMENILLSDWINNTKHGVDSLVCTITENCPYKCSCLDYQYTRNVIVNCTGAGLTRLPDDMPVGHWNNRKLDLIFVGCNIELIENRHYMNRIQSIKMPGNAIKNINDDAIASFPDDFEIDLSGSDLSTLPYSFRSRNPNFITFPRIPITCSCNNIWIADWLRSHRVLRSLKCIANGIIKFVEDVTEEELDCPVPVETWRIALTGVLSALFILILLFAVILYMFNNELLVLIRRKSNTFKRDKKVFILFDDDDDSLHILQDNVSLTVMKWIHCYLVKRLHEEGYVTFVQFMNVPYGANIEHDVTEAISIHKTYIIFYTKHFCENENTFIHFNNLWNCYKENSDREILLINFDYTCTNKVSDRKLRALFRASRPLDFTETRDSLINRLIKRLGSQIKNKSADEIADRVEIELLELD